MQHSTVFLVVAICSCLALCIAATEVDNRYDHQADTIKTLDATTAELNNGAEVHTRTKRTLFLKKKLIGAGLLGFGVGVAKGYRYIYNHLSWFRSWFRPNLFLSLLLFIPFIYLFLYSFSSFVLFFLKIFLSPATNLDTTVLPKFIAYMCHHPQLLNTWNTLRNQFIFQELSKNPRQFTKRHI